MYTYKCLNNISQVGLAGFSADYKEVKDPESADMLLVRSAKLHDTVFDKETVAIARAGAGVNNIPLDRCAEEGIVVFNTPGANANAVKELFVFACIAGVRDIVPGMAWAKHNALDPDIAANAEKEKKKFVGHEIAGKRLGVIGLGAIGAKVANVAVSLGMKVYGYDAFLNDAMRAGLSPEVTVLSSNEEVVASSDIITLHVPALDSTKGMINSELLSKADDGLVVINLARDTLVDTPSIKEALESGKVSRYVCDFPTADTAKIPGVVLIPHLGASTEEAEDNCAAMAVSELRDFIENGNIKNSVNYPAVSLGDKKGARICICHKSGVSADDIKTAAGVSVTGAETAKRGDFAYTLLEIEGASADAKAKLEATDGILRVRVID